LRKTAGHAVTDLSLIGRGEWSTSFSFKKGGKAFVIRFSDYREDYAKDRIAYSFQAPDLPVPQVTQLGEAFGGYYAISEKLAGTAIDFLDAVETRRTIPAVFRLLDALRLLDISGSQGYGYWSEDRRGVHTSWKQELLDVTIDPPAKRIHGWKHRLSETMGLAQFSHLQQTLVSLTGCCPEERHLIHSDLLHYNLLVEDGKISAVLDWGNAIYGDFLYELAWFTFWSAWHPAMDGIDFRKLASDHYLDIGLAVPNLEERLACYELHIGLDAIAYCSFIGNWSQVKQLFAQAQEIADRA
jgi:hygromycin-B 4-O-kinase